MEGCDASCVTSLKELVNSNNTDKIAQIKSRLRNISFLGDSREGDISSSIVLLFDNEDEEIRILSAQAIAELLKNDENRQIYAKEEIVSRLLKYLEKPVTSANLELMKQTCRALGNICYENSTGRDCINRLEGVPKLVSILGKAVEACPVVDNGSLSILACKMLSNFMLGEDCIKPCLQSKLSDYFLPLLKMNPPANLLIEWKCTILNLITTVAKEEVEYVFSDEENLLVVDILKTSDDFETLEFCVDFLQAQAEHDHIKLLYAEKGVVNLLLSKIRERSGELLIVDDGQDNEDLRDMMKNALNIIVLVLTGDESMTFLYQDGKGDVYKGLVECLNSTDMDILISAMLAIGNFARKDTNCIRMMEEGVFDKVFDVLEKQKETLVKREEWDLDMNCDIDGRLYHAILSTIRNMVVPHHNKKIAVSKGKAVSTLLVALPEAKHPQIAFKVIQALRMLVDGQESVAEKLVNDTDAMKAAMEWGTRSEHAGLLGEVPRLLAWAIKQLCKRSDMQRVIEMDGCVALIVNMLSAPHIIMQNEAIIALSKLVVTSIPVIPESDNNKCKEEKLHYDENNTNNQEKEITSVLVKQIIAAEIGKNVNILLESNLAKMEPEMLQNIVTFVQLIVRQDGFHDHFKETSTATTLKKFMDKRKGLTELQQCTLQEILNTIDGTRTNVDK